ncbi:peroxide stress protein YaaA [Hoylesella shahii]|uniref:peroxide stress protein YaaA n=1 Tax=Hoylesella shahii TaxID=228603 RepID=UPI0035AB9C74
MQILLSCAKDMATLPTTYPGVQENAPHFIANAKDIAAEMMNFSAEELAQLLKINDKLANQNWLRYQHFLQEGDTSHAPWHSQAWPTSILRPIHSTQKT